MTDEASIDSEQRRQMLDQITERIIGCVHQVSNTLGSGFLEKVWQSSSSRTYTPRNV